MQFIRPQASTVQSLVTTTMLDTTGLGEASMTFRGSTKGLNGLAFDNGDELDVTIRRTDTNAVIASATLVIGQDPTTVAGVTAETDWLTGGGGFPFADYLTTGTILDKDSLNDGTGVTYIFEKKTWAIDTGNIGVNLGLELQVDLTATDTSAALTSVLTSATINKGRLIDTYRSSGGRIGNCTSATNPDPEDGYYVSFTDFRKNTTMFPSTPNTLVNEWSEDGVTWYSQFQTGPRYSNETYQNIAGVQSLRICTDGDAPNNTADVNDTVFRYGRGTSGIHPLFAHTALYCEHRGANRGLGFLRTSGGWIDPAWTEDQYADEVQIEVISTNAASPIISTVQEGTGTPSTSITGTTFWFGDSVGQVATAGTQYDFVSNTPTPQDIIEVTSHPFSGGEGIYKARAEQTLSPTPTIGTAPIAWMDYEYIVASF